MVALLYVLIPINILVYHYVLLKVMQKASPHMMKAEMVAVPLDLCNISYVPLHEIRLPRGIINPGHVCAKQATTGTSNACQVSVTTSP
jgi:hypothetical protein